MSASERRIAELEAEVRTLTNECGKLREELVKVAGGADSLEMESGVNKDYEPFIRVRWGAEVGQLGPGEARIHGLRMLECAEAAEADAALLKGFRELDAPEDMAFALLRLIRANRTGDETKSA